MSVSYACFVICCIKEIGIGKIMPEVVFVALQQAGFR
jgi:hypothetical protein